MSDTSTKKKKVSTRKEKLKLAEEAAKKRIREEENERLLLKREEERKLQKEMERRKMETEKQQHEIRLEELGKLCETFKNLINEMMKHKSALRLDNQLPDLISCQHSIRIVPCVNEYISRWRDDSNQRFADIETKILRSIDIIDILSNFIEDPFDIKNLSIWVECRNDLRDLIHAKLDRATYFILRNIEKEMDYIDMETMNFKEFNEYFKLLLWLILEKRKPSKEEKSFSCNFDECGITIQLPKTFCNAKIAVRCMWMKHDLYTDDSRSCWKEEHFPAVESSILQLNKNHWKRKQVLYERQQQEELRMQNEKDKRKRIINKIRYLLPTVVADSSRKSDQEDELTDSVTDTVVSADGLADDSELNAPGSRYIHPTKKTIDQILIEEQQTEMDELKTHLEFETEKHELNMRRHSLIGGIYHVDLLKQPNQPKTLKDGSSLTFLIGPDDLQRWDYLEVYEPAAAQTGKQSTDDEDDDSDTAEGHLLANLVLVSIKLPTHVLWLDIPTPVQWDFEKRCWSTEYVYDSKFNEEKQLLTFRAGKMTPFGLSISRYTSLPYQTWELKPGIKTGQAILCITSATAIVDFVIEKNLVCLSQVQNITGDVLDDVMGVFLEPVQLIRHMRRIGLDLFPQPDAYLHVDNVPNKHRLTENHVYHCMALVCHCYYFSWSRWNLSCGFKKFVMQTREMSSLNENNELLLTTSEKAVLVECTEASQKFTEKGNGNKFYSNLYHLFLDRPPTKSSIIDVEPIFVETVYFMLRQTRVLSFA